jgi:hypothetical protein
LSFQGDIYAISATVKKLNAIYLVRKRSRVLFGGERGKEGGREGGREEGTEGGSRSHLPSKKHPASHPNALQGNMKSTDLSPDLIEADTCDIAH